MNEVDSRAVLTDFLATWGRHHSAGDTDALVTLYTDDPLFFGSTPELRTGRAGVRAYFEELEAHEEAVVDFEVLAATAPAPGVIAGASVGTFRWRGNPGIPIRFTHTLVHRHGRWVAAAHHASPR
jgi:ketosteroid isomerase-like protein